MLDCLYWLITETSRDLGLKSLKNVLAAVYNVANMLTPSVHVSAKKPNGALNIGKRTIEDDHLDCTSEVMNL